MSEPGAGRVIDKKYELIHKLGKGGMSIVWLGRDRRLDKVWAVKEIMPNVIGAQGEANRKAIIDEANFMKRLDHPAIPRVVDIIDEGRTIYVVMDYINGRSLSKTMRQQGGPFDQLDVIDWGIQLCDVVGYLHGLNPPVVYRDLKPGNIMLRDDGSVKLIDFGIAYELRPGRIGDAGLIGSPGYSAPEQIDAEVHKNVPLSTRSDIYALGATLYSLVTGTKPEKVRDSEGAERFEYDIRPIREIDPQLSDGLEQIILRATKPDPADRYQTIDEMRYDLEHYEELTQEYRAVQQRKLDTFWGRVRATAIVAVLGLACLLASNLLKNSSYDSIMHEANVASKAERNVKLDEGTNVALGGNRIADASEAEELYTRAISVDPTRSEPYDRLLNEVYKDDFIFTPTEADRWVSVWQNYGRNLKGSDQYARLCYDAGILYLCYYDYLGNADLSEEASTAASGQGAIQNASRSAEWFALAKAAAEEDPTNHAGLQVDENLDELAAVEVFETIGTFHKLFSQANREGKVDLGSYVSFWGALEESVIGSEDKDPIVAQSEKMVQLRLYQVAFESIASSTYLSGFMEAGITEDQVNALLDAVHTGTQSLSEFVATNREAAGAMYDEIVDGYDAAVDNISRTYHNPLSKSNEQAETTEGE